MKALRSVLVVLVTAAGASVVASAAYAADPVGDDKGVIHGCVNDRTGALRVIDLSDDEECRTQGRRKETAISWDEAKSDTASASSDPASAAQGSTSSGLQNLDQLSGLACDVNSTQKGVVEITYSSSGQISMTCQKAATSSAQPGVAQVVPGASSTEPGTTPAQNGATSSQDVAPIQTGP